MHTMTPLEQQVYDFLEKYHLEARELLLGFSGGADSTALFLMLKNTGCRFRAVHFEHGIRGEEALRDADWCRRFSEENHIPFECHSLQVPEHCRPGEGIEEAARRLRLERWRKLAEHLDCPVLLAHHHDDCLENFFLRLGRGAGSSGLAGLREFRSLGSLRIYRPMLSIRRSELEKYLLAQGVSDWCRDSTNSDVVYRRNAVRHQLLPLWRSIFQDDRNLSCSLQILSEEAGYLEELAEKYLPGLDSLSAWRRIPSVLLPRVLRRWWNCQTGQDRVFNGNDYSSLRKALGDFSSGERQLVFSGGLSVILSDSGLRLCGDHASVRDRIWNWRAESCLEMPEIGYAFRVLGAEEPAPECSELFRSSCLGASLNVRSWRKGDRMQPFGCGFHKKLQDLWNEAGIPAERRQSVPILLNAGEIIWVPGVRRAEFGRVSGSEETVRLCLVRLPR